MVHYQYNINNVLFSVAGFPKLIDNKSKSLDIPEKDSELLN
jgi:hypothetical protein